MYILHSQNLMGNDFTKYFALRYLKTFSKNPWNKIQWGKILWNAITLIIFREINSLATSFVKTLIWRKNVAHLVFNVISRALLSRNFCQSEEAKIPWKQMDLFPWGFFTKLIHFAVAHYITILHVSWTHWILFRKKFVFSRVRVFS